MSTGISSTNCMSNFALLANSRRVWINLFGKIVCGNPSNAILTTSRSVCKDFSTVPPALFTSNSIGLYQGISSIRTWCSIVNSINPRRFAKDAFNAKCSLRKIGSCKQAPVTSALMRGTRAPSISLDETKPFSINACGVSMTHMCNLFAIDFGTSFPIKARGSVFASVSKTGCVKQAGSSRPLLKSKPSVRFKSTDAKSAGAYSGTCSTL
mmetsp:Transcript_46400/g.73262  ORF Transcript_46400/g.73262 Transcript_46400/m.73262 type:complete len:210 (+) Transcript_46400:163-792(+)